MKATEIQKLKKLMNRPRPAWMGAIDRGDPRVLHYDDDMLIFNKPPGISTVREHESHKENDMFAIGRLFTEAKTQEEKPYLGVVHKLDKYASGLLVFSRNQQFTRGLNHLLRKREVKKTYFCIITGMIKQKGILEHHIFKDDANRQMVCFEEDEVPNIPRGAIVQKASLHYEPIFHLGHRKRGHLTCMKVTMRTGRKHQIRSQFSKFGYPVLGDYKYGDRRPFLKHSIALHAMTFSFRHPFSQAPFDLYANLPLAWLELFPKDVLEMLVREHWGREMIHSQDAHRIGDIEFEKAHRWRHYQGQVKSMHK